MHKRTFRCAALILGIIAASPSWCQTRQDQNKSTLPNFDIRDAPPPAEPFGAPQGQARTLVDRRGATLEAFPATPEGAGVRIAPNRFGLPKVMIREGGVLSAPSTMEPEEIARGFLRSHASLFGLAAPEVDQLRLLVNDSAGGPTFLAFNQTLDGIDVLNGQVKFTLTSKGEVVQVAVADVVPQLDLPATPRLSAQDAARAACAASGVPAPTMLAPVADPSGMAAFRNPRGAVYRPITVELFIFPMTASTARLAYRVYFEANDAASYEILVDAQDGTLLYRHNRWLADARGMVWQVSPMNGTRQETTFPTAPIASSTDPGPWLPTGGTVTTGNNVDAYLDADGDDNPDYTTNANMQYGRAYSASQSFDFSFGDGTTGQNPRSYQPMAVTNLFYFVNMAHDYYYSLGFTEAAGNLQTDNYGRGGVGNDAVLAEAQFGGFTDNSDFSPTPDGKAPRMRMGLFTRGSYSLNDDLDSDYEGQLVFHEYGHGVSNRLVGARTSTSCLDSVQSGAMGEGWSDYFAISNFNNPVFAAYVSQNPVSGMRRYSYDGYPYTYEDIGNGAYGYEVHDDGEIWAATLWDLRKSLGQAVADQLVVDGLKSTPCSPSMTNARDAILAADQARYGGADRTVIWQIFAKHGMGYSAMGVDGDIEAGTRYDAAYDEPPDLQTAKNPAITSDPLAVSTSDGGSYAYKVTASNPNGGTLTFLLTSGPLGMAVNPINGTVNWTASFQGQRVKITVSDGQGGTVVHGYLLPVSTQLADGAPIAISGPEDDAGNLMGFATFTVPANELELQVTLRNGTGGAVLYVDAPQGYAYGSFRYGDQTLTFPSPSAGVWQIAVDGWLAYSGVSLTAALIAPTTLGVNSSLSGLSGVEGSETLYRVTIPAGTAHFTVSTSGGNGDEDLYLSKGYPAACQSSPEVYGLCVYDYSSTAFGNGESITVANPAAADWYIDMSGYADYNGVTLSTYITAAPPAITTTSPLPPGSVGTAYSQTLSAAGGVPPYTWTLLSGALPAGLTLSPGGTISGTPTTAAASNFSIQVQDSAAATATASFSLVITLTAPCSYSVSPASQTFAAAGGAAAFAVTAPAGCAWTASTSLDWVSITSGSAGSGNGSVAIQASSNGATNRSGSITVAGQSVPIQQASTLCTFSLYPAGQAFPIAGGSGTINVTAPAGCPWGTSGLPGWVTIASGASGGGNGTVAYQAAPNAADWRTASFTVGGAPFVIEQSSGTLGTIPTVGAMPHVAYGGGWQTSIVLMNNGTAAAQARLNFFDDTGAAVILPWAFPQAPLSGPLLGAQLERTIAPGAAVVIQTSATSDIGLGAWAQLQSNGNITAFARFNWTVGGGAQEAVVPLESRNPSSFTLWYDNTGDFATGIAVANVAAAGGNVQATVRDDTGALVGTETLTLAAYGHTAFMLTDHFATTGQGRGTIEFTPPAGGQIAPLAFRASTAGILSTIPSMVQPSATPGTMTTMGAMAHVATAGGWQTAVVLVNLGSSAARAHLSFFDDSGAPLPLPLCFPQTPSASSVTESELEQSIAPGAALVVQTCATGDISIGSWAQLQSDGNITGFARFNWTVGTGVQEAVVPLESRNPDAFVLWYDNTGGFATGIALANVTSPGASVQATVRDDTGALIGTETLPLGAEGHMAFMLTDHFATAQGRGTVEFQTPAGGQIAPLAFRASTAGILSTIPATVK